LWRGYRCGLSTMKAVIATAVSWASGSRMSIMAMSAPVDAGNSAMARPMPRALQ
jgi:hypothetical protein